jgi:ribonuclease E
VPASLAASEPVFAVAPPVPTPAPAPALAAPAPIAPYVLPTDSLIEIASNVGLEWVNSDHEKIRSVQAAMAAEPRPVHVPRAPRPAVTIADGPLVLVETRKDLSQLTLPFEQRAG